MELHHPNQPEPAESHKRFQAAVDVIQNLPKHGSFRPSYEVMLRFYGLYKQAMFGPCRASRPGFWDPVGWYKWDAWNQLGDMSCERAMTAYVDEIKKVAQEVIDKMPMNEKTASFFHYFEPLYHVIHDMPRPPDVLLSLRPDINANKSNESLAVEVNGSTSEQMIQKLEEQKLNSEPFLNNHSEKRALSDALVLTSDSESEIFCDSVEQLDYIKQVPETYCDLDWHHNHTPVSQVNQLGAGQGGEGADDGHGFPLRRREQSGKEMRQGRREPPCDLPHSNGRRAGRQASGAEGGDDSDGGGERFQDPQVQQQIMLALLRLRDDMRSVIERLEVMEGLAAANAHDSQWITHRQFTVAHTEVENWWPFNSANYSYLAFHHSGNCVLSSTKEKKPQ